MKTVTAAVIRKNSSILLARRASGEKLEGKWEFPGGKLEPNESEPECLRRELHEEFGVEAQIGCYVAESIYEYDHGAIRLTAYEVEHISGELQPTVHDAIEWVPVEDLLNYDLAPADVPLAKHLLEIES